MPVRIHLDTHRWMVVLQIPWDRGKLQDSRSKFQEVSKEDDQIKLQKEEEINKDDSQVQMLRSLQRRRPWLKHQACPISRKAEGCCSPSSAKVMAIPLGLYPIASYTYAAVLMSPYQGARMSCGITQCEGDSSNDSHHLRQSRGSMCLRSQVLRRQSWSTSSWSYDGRQLNPLAVWS